ADHCRMRALAVRCQEIALSLLVRRPAKADALLQKIFAPGFIENFEFLIGDQGRPFAHPSGPKIEEFAAALVPLLRCFDRLAVLKLQHRPIVAKVIGEFSRRGKVRSKFLPKSGSRLFVRLPGSSRSRDHGGDESEGGEHFKQSGGFKNCHHGYWSRPFHFTFYFSFPTFHFSFPLSAFLF